MNLLLIAGIALAGWTLLLILASERQRRLVELEARRQQALAELRRQQEEQAAQIPVIG